MFKYLFRLKALFETVMQQREELTDHRQKTRRAFLKFKRDQRKSERCFASHEKLIKALSLQVKHLVEPGQLPQEQQPPVRASAEPQTVMAQANDDIDGLSFAAFCVIVASLTTDERKIVEALFAEVRPFSYADLRALLGKRTIHAIKKHIHNMQAKGFILVAHRESNGQKFYTLDKNVRSYLEKQSDKHRTKVTRKQPVKNRGHEGKSRG